jgi:hypothetical protein
MSAFGLVISITIPILVLLGVAVFVSKQQQKKLGQKARARAIKDFVIELTEAFEFLIKVDNQKEIQTLIFSRIQQLNDRYVDSLPKQLKTGASAVDIEGLKQKLAKGGNKKSILTSDREIRYAKKQFSKILKSFGPMIKSKMVSEATIMEFRRYLRISVLEMEVDSFTSQGDLAAQRGDVTSASGYYKEARKNLINFKLQYSEKNERIKSLASKTAALFNGGEEKQGSLAKGLSEEKPEKDEHGFPVDPNEDTKQKF